jgi:hypothetical protein
MAKKTLFYIVEEQNNEQITFSEAREEFLNISNYSKV